MQLSAAELGERHSEGRLVERERQEWMRGRREEGGEKKAARRGRREEGGEKRDCMHTLDSHLSCSSLLVMSTWPTLSHPRGNTPFSAMSSALLTLSKTSSHGVRVR